MTTNQLMFMFPGVGSHYSGMGKTFYDQFSLVQDLFAEASDILHQDMSKLCFSSEHAAELSRLENVQAALLCVSVAAYRVLVAETGLQQAFYLGYSLGEYAALCCAGALELKDALQLVWDRGVIVTDVADTVGGSMTWVINVAAQQIEEICQQLRQEGEHVFVSAYDSPVKTSISGTQTALRKAGERIVNAGGIPIPIKMSGPFHSPLMHDATVRFHSLLQEYTYTSPRFPVISNFTARVYETEKEIPDNLEHQLVNPIRWQHSLQLAHRKGVTTSVEIGPKNVLTYLLAKNLPHITTYELDTIQKLQQFKEATSIKWNDYSQFLSKCLTLIVGTKNYNDDVQAYEKTVIPAFRQIEQTYEEMQAGKVIPDTALSTSTIKLLTSALLAKSMPEAEVTARVKQLSDRYIVF